MMKKAVLILLICLSNGWLFANHWTPIDSGYEDNMTLTGIIQIDGIEQQSTMLEVGVFCGEECRGSGYPTYFVPMQRYVIQLLVFGEVGDQLTFRLYDSDLGQELNSASPNAVTFIANGYGSLLNPYVLDFRGNSNHWIPNQTSYEDNMTLTGVIQIDGVEQQSTTLEVGVFCGGECRGTGYPTYFPPTQRYVIQLLIYGEAGDQLTFKLYDSDLGEELNLNSPEAVTFSSNGYGSLSDPYILNFTEMVGESFSVSANINPTMGGTVQGTGIYQIGQTCTLLAAANEGYAFSNWTENGTVVSTNPTYAFPVTSNHTLVANFTITGNNTHWIPNELSYEDNMTLTGVIQINGVEQQSTTLEVGVFCGDDCRGTGLANYFFPTQRFVIQLLIFGESGDQLTFRLYDHSLGQELNLNVPEAVTFTSNGYGSLSDPYILNFTDDGSPLWVPNESGYEDNMTLTGVIQINGVEQQSTTLEVGAFCGEECRGTGLVTYFFPTQRYVVQLLIFGETGDQLTFKLYDHAIGQELNLTSPDAITFVANGYGTLGNPYILNFTGATAFHFITPGNWSTASNWQEGTLPGADDVAFIDASCQLDQDAEVAALAIADGQTLIMQSGKTLTVNGLLFNSSTAGLVIKDGAQLINASGNVAATMEKDIVAYSNSNPDAWYTIASPMNEMPIEGSGFATPEFDLYRFNESNLTNEEWENYKGGLADFTTFENGRGYLFANSNAFSPAFTGTLNASAVSCPLSFTERPNDPLSGFNLIGNPFPHDIYKGSGGAIDNANLASGYYTLTNEGRWQVHTFEDAIHPGQGILVKATAPTVLTIAKSNEMASSESGEAKGKTNQLRISVKGDNGQDQTYVYFGQGVGLDKKNNLDGQAPSLWVRANGNDYAIAHVDSFDESLELCFSGEQEGDFTLSVVAGNTKFKSLQLTDRATGTTVDLLKQPNYSFHATGQEPRARFCIEFRMME